MSVHVRPEQVFTLNRNGCSFWAGICSYLLFLDIDEIDEGKVKAALKDRKGWLFKTGNGFHFVGAKIYPSKKEWERRYKQAAKSKKLKGLVDDRHVDFSLRRGYSTLRTDRSADKKFVPFMCWDNSK